MVWKYFLEELAHEYQRRNLRELLRNRRIAQSSADVAARNAAKKIRIIPEWIPVLESLCAAEDIGSDKIIRKLGIPNRYYYIYTSHNYIVIRLLFMIYRIVISVFTILLHHYVRRYLSLFVSAFIMTKIRGALFRSTFFPPLGFCAFRARKKRNSFAAPSVSRAKHHQNFPVSRSMRRIVPRGIRRTRVTLSWVKNAFERGHSIPAIPSRRYSTLIRYRAWYYGISAILDPVSDVVRKY